MHQIHAQAPCPALRHRLLRGGAFCLLLLAQLLPLLAPAANLAAGIWRTHPGRRQHLAPGAWVPGRAAGFSTPGSPRRVRAVPTLTGVSPRLGVPGTVLTLTGADLGGTTSISFTGSAGAKEVTSGFVVNAAGTQITGVVVPAAAQSGPVTVSTAGGTSAVGTALFSLARTLTAGGEHTVAIRADGRLLVWGDNLYGQLGLGTQTNQPSPVLAGTATNWASVEGGDYHTMAVRADGTLWAWGYNAYGQLGLGNTVYQYRPVQVGTATNWVSVAASGFHTLAVRADGTLWAWGLNSSGQLGLGNTTQQLSPVRVGTATNWVSVAAGYDHTVGVQADGTLWTWGANLYGQLGLGITTSQLTSPSQVGTATNWVSAAPGSYYTMALRADGTLWAWGYNTYGQLGVGNTTQQNRPVLVGATTSWVSAAAGIGHVVAVRADGTLWAWGANGNGQLGLGNNTPQSRPVQVGTATSWASVSAGMVHTVAEQSCQAVWAWGNNAKGQVGDGSPTLRLDPVLVVNPVRLLSFSPASAVAGTTVAVTGTGLLGLTALTVNGIDALPSVTGLTNTDFSFVVPAGATSGPGTVSVTASCGSASSAAFTVTVLATTPGQARPGLRVFPNPAQAGTATLTGATPGTVVTVFDALGRRVASAPADGAGTAALVLPAGLPAGVYVVRVGQQALRLTVE